jgi:pyruvate formate lyase activating enzyme
MGLIFDIKRFAIHDGPGIRTTVFLKGCPLTCVWCHNPEGISQTPDIMWSREQCIACKTCENTCPHNALHVSDIALQVDAACTLCGACAEECPSHALKMIGKEMTVPQVVAEVEKDMIFYDQSQGGVTFSGGEPLMQPDFLLKLLKACKTQGIHTAVDTSGFAPFNVLSRVSEYTDVFLYDVKVINDTTHKKYTGVSNRSILKNLETLSGENEIIVRYPVIPGVNDSKKDVSDFRDFVSSLHLKEVTILPYHKAGIEKGNKLIPPTELFIADVPSAETIAAIEKVLKNVGLQVTRGG